jgi:RNA polymerase subunit RPABC4/transcription elongation factor Spt4
VACYTISKALELFHFPPNHPIANTAYAMADVYPDSYVPLSGFHEYYKLRKHQAFTELCAALGAKEIDIESAVINDQTLDVYGDISSVISNLGLGINAHENSETGMKVAFRFAESNNEIRDYDSPWLQTEPSWMAMNNMRRKSHLAELGADFNYTDEMGVNANAAAKFAKMGVNIGGKFTEMTKIHLSYHVVFWETAEKAPAAPQEAALVCPNCGTKLAKGAKFCPECGAKVAPPVCPKCGTQLKAGTKFCPECGTKIQ